MTDIAHNLQKLASPLFARHTNNPGRLSMTVSLIFAELNNWRGERKKDYFGKLCKYDSFISATNWLDAIRCMDGLIKPACNNMRKVVVALLEGVETASIIRRAL